MAPYDMRVLPAERRGCDKKDAHVFLCSSDKFLPEIQSSIPGTMVATCTENVLKHDVHFPSDHLTLGGTVQWPEGQGPFPTVVLGHGLNGLKEWTLPDVAASLVEAGIAAFWFDYRNYGDSEGTPRDEVSHYGRIQDWQNAITYVTTLPKVDESRIGVWGTSLGGRDILAFSWLDRRVKAVVAQAPLIKWTMQSAAAMAGQKDDIAGFQNDLAADRKNRALGKEPKYLDFVRPMGDDVKAAFIAQLNEADRRNYSGRITLQSYQPTTLIDVTPFVELLAPTPVLFVLAEQDFLPGQMAAYEAAKGPKWLARVPGNHFSPYVESKERSIAVAREFFVRVLLEDRADFELGEA
jgi:uncharacterized protein